MVGGISVEGGGWPQGTPTGGRYSDHGLLVSVELEISWRCTISSITCTRARTAPGRHRHTPTT